MLIEFNANQWDTTFLNDITAHATEALEQGKILFLPQLAFALNPTRKKIFVAAICSS